MGPDHPRPPARVERAEAGGWRRHALLLAALAVIAALTTLALLPNQGLIRLFRTGPVRLAVAGAEVGEVGRYGPVAVTRGHFYQVNLRVEGTAPFVFHLDGQDGTASKHYAPPLSFDRTSREAWPILRAAHDDPAAMLVVEASPTEGTTPLRVERLRIYEIRGAFYVLRAVARVGATLGLLAGFSMLGWRCYERWRAATEAGGLGASVARRAAAWTAALLTLAVGSGVFVWQDQHVHLIRAPTSPSIYGWDASFYYFWLRSALVEGDVDFAKDLRACNSMPPELRAETLEHTRRTKLGLIPNKYPIGWALSGVPWFVAADTVARVANAAGALIPRDGWGPLYQGFLVLGQAVYALAGLWLAYRIVATWLPPVFAAAGMALGWLCSPLAYYQTLGVAMSHNVMFCAVVGAYFCALRLRADPARVRWWVLVGVSCALAILARYQGAVLLLFPGVVCLQALWAAPGRWTHLLAGLAASAVPLALQACAWKALYGTWLLYTYEGEGFDWLRPHVWESLFSPFHGLFNWHPALVAGFAGFVAWAVRTPRRTEAVCFAASLGLTIYINGAWQCWWFGDSFGGRAYEGCTLYAMLGFAWLLRALSGRAAAFHLAAAAGLLAALWSVNLLWLSHDGSLLLSRPVPWSEKLTLTRHYWLPR